MTKQLFILKTIFLIGSIGAYEYEITGLPCRLETTRLRCATALPQLYTTASRLPAKTKHIAFDGFPIPIINAVLKQLTVDKSNAPTIETLTINNCTKTDAFLTLERSFLKQLRHLSLTNCKLRSEDLPTNVLSQLAQLETLDLSQNRLVTIPDAALQNCTSLKVLNLSRNALIDPTFGLDMHAQPFQLGVIDLSYNPEIKRIPAHAFEVMIGWAKTEKHINVSHCGLEGVDKGAFIRLYHLTSLDISSNPLNQTALLTILRDIEASYTLHTLTMSDLRIVDPYGLFINSGLPTLKTIDLSSNQIVKFQPSIFRFCGNLTTVNLRRNHITTVGEFTGTRSTLNIRTLHLDSNRLKDERLIDFMSLSTLTTLTMSWNKLPEIGTTMFTPLFNLEHLDVSFNMITTMYSDSVFQKLTFANFSYNRITQITLQNLHSIVTIDLSHNLLTNIQPYTFALASKIRSANFSRNQITIVAPDAFALACPPELDLSYNRLTAIGYWYWAGLVELDVSHNHLRSIDEVTFITHPHLLKLNLAANMLKSLPTYGFRNQTLLTHLDLSDNVLGPYIISMDGYDLLSNFPSLTHLNLAHNRIEALPMLLLENRHITHLNVSHNRLVNFKLDKLVDGLVRIESLDISYNKINTIQMEDGFETQSLRHLDASFNPFNCDCRLYAFVVHFSETSTVADFHRNGSYVCKYPVAFSGDALASIDERLEVECVNNDIIFRFAIAAVPFAFSLVFCIIIVILCRRKQAGRYSPLKRENADGMPMTTLNEATAEQPYDDKLMSTSVYSNGREHKATNKVEDGATRLTVRTPDLNAYTSSNGLTLANRYCPPSICVTRRVETPDSSTSAPDYPYLYGNERNVERLLMTPANQRHNKTLPSDVIAVERQQKPIRISRA